MDVLLEIPVAGWQVRLCEEWDSIPEVWSPPSSSDCQDNSILYFQLLLVGSHTQSIHKSKKFPTSLCKILLTPNSLWRNSFHLGVWGMIGPCSKGMFGVPVSPLYQPPNLNWSLQDGGIESHFCGWCSHWRKPGTWYRPFPFPVKQVMDNSSGLPKKRRHMSCDWKFQKVA